MGWEGYKSLISFILGIIIGGLGLIPILNNLNILSWSIPDLPETVLLILLIVGGAYLMIDGFMGVAMIPMLGWISIFGGVATAIIALMKLLGKYATVLVFLEGTFLNVIFLLVGFLLFIGSFLMF